MQPREISAVFFWRTEMAVNPKIIMMAVQAAKSEKVRKAVLYIVLFNLFTEKKIIILSVI